MVLTKMNWKNYQFQLETLYEIALNYFGPIECMEARIILKITKYWKLEHLDPYRFSIKYNFSNLKAHIVISYFCT